MGLLKFLFGGASDTIRPFEQLSIQDRGYILVAEQYLEDAYRIAQNKRIWNPYLIYLFIGDNRECWCIGLYFDGGYNTCQYISQSIESDMERRIGWTVMPVEHDDTLMCYGESHNFSCSKKEFYHHVIRLFNNVHPDVVIEQVTSGNQIDHISIDVRK